MKERLYLLWSSGNLQNNIRIQERKGNARIDFPRVSGIFCSHTDNSNNGVVKDGGHTPGNGL